MARAKGQAPAAGEEGAERPLEGCERGNAASSHCTKSSAPISNTDSAIPFRRPSPHISRRSFSIAGARVDREEREGPAEEGQGSHEAVRGAGLQAGRVCVQERRGQHHDPSWPEARKPGGCPSDASNITLVPQAPALPFHHRVFAVPTSDSCASVLLL